MRRKGAGLLLALIAPAALVSLIGFPSKALAVNFQVDSVLDARDANLADGLCASAQGSCSLRAAIEQANALEGNDVIQLPNGEYLLTLTGPNEDGSVSGDLDISSTLSILSNDAAATRVVGSGDRVLDVQLGAIAAITRVTVTGGGGVAAGGGIRNAGTLVLTGCEVIGNGGDGRAVTNGGGIFNLGVLTLAGGAVVANQVQSSSPIPVAGAGIYSTTGMLLTAVRVDNNNALGNNAVGGGIQALAPGVVQIAGGSVIGNRATLGAGIHVAGAEVNVNGASIAANSATRSGAGARVLSGALVLTNTTFSGNNANEDGGGVALNGGSLSGYNVTFANNLADADLNGSGGGGGIAQTGAATAQLFNSIVASNLDASPTGTLAADCIGTLASGGFNLIGTTMGCNFVALGTDQVNLNAGLAALASNNGATPTHALLVNSPALDAGDPAGCLDSTMQALLTDQRGLPRNRDGNGDGTARCDSGAYELQPESIAPIFTNGFESP